MGMDTNLLNYIDAFNGIRAIVVGEAMLDSYLIGVTERLCREAPVPVVSLTARQHVPGGAANAAVNVRSLGAEVFFLSVTGNDPEGALLRQALEKDGVSTEHVIVHAKRATLAKQRVIASSQMVVRFDSGTTEPLDRATEEALIKRLKKLYPGSDAIIISDYDYGILTPRLIQVLAELQRRYPRVVTIDSKRLPAYQAVNITAVKPNYSEVLQLLGLQKPGGEYECVEQITPLGEQVLEKTGAQIAAVTLDTEGALVFEAGQQPYRTYAHPEPHSRAAGAGDTFAAALTLALAAGAYTPAAAEIASAAASIVVSKEGTSACFADELRSHFTADDKFITDAFQLTARIAAYRRQGKRIVFTNGCFDILHRGHVTYLNHAKEFGDILVVGLNSDASVSRLKGPNRPINSLEDRSQILAALSCVDHIVPFDADTPHDLIRVIQPDIFVKGGDYTRRTLPEAHLVEELGGQVEILPYEENHSTTGIIERIRQLYRIEGKKTELEKRE